MNYSMNVYMKQVGLQWFKGAIGRLGIIILVQISQSSTN